MPLRIELIPTLEDNFTYLLICQQTGQAAILDAPEVEPVVRRVETLGVQVTSILSTHHHWDHAQANPELARCFGGIPVIGHISDAHRLPGYTHGVEEGDQVQVGEARGEVLHIPAHTTGHVAYSFADSAALFCGDTLFSAGCGRLFEGDAGMLAAALNRFDHLPGETLVYCGHEYSEENLRFAELVEPDNQDIQNLLAEVLRRRALRVADWHDAGPEEMTVPTTLATERAVNPFLRAGSVEELGRRRAWRDRF